MSNPDRRTFIKLGAATVASSIVANRLIGQTSLRLHPSVNEDTFRMPGNTTIPGDATDKQWPDLKKYEGKGNKEDLRRMLLTTEVEDTVQFFGWTTLDLWTIADSSLPWQVVDVFGA